MSNNDEDLGARRITYSTERLEALRRGASYDPLNARRNGASTERLDIRRNANSIERLDTGSNANSTDRLNVRRNGQSTERLDARRNGNSTERLDERINTNSIEHLDSRSNTNSTDRLDRSITNSTERIGGRRSTNPLERTNTNSTDRLDFPSLHSLSPTIPSLSSPPIELQRLRNLRPLPRIDLPPSSPLPTLPDSDFSNLEMDEPGRRPPRKTLKQKLRMLAVCMLVTIIFITAVVIVAIVLTPRPGPRIAVDLFLPIEQQKWWDQAINDMNEALDVKPNFNIANNVILFIGDGMGPNTITASRIHQYKEEGLMTWENFPHMGMLKTYCADKQVPDSFSTATSLFGGVKVNYGTGGVDSTVNYGNCRASLNKLHKVNTIFKWAQDEGLNTGFVTTTRVTHATPAALYANVPDRKWECDARMSEKNRRDGCKDIARILIEDDIGKNINVIMGGGRQCLVSGLNGTKADPIDEWACQSEDGRDLIYEWIKTKISERKRYAMLTRNADLNTFDADNSDYVLGIFANSHLKYDYERDEGPDGTPSLNEMTQKALQVLLSKGKRFLLVVEGGLIDQAHHRGYAQKAVLETLALDLTVKNTIKKLGDKLDETLIIVTADHSHTLTINGYSDIGSNIFGIASKSKFDGTPYTTLTYGTGHFGGDQYYMDNDTNIIKRRNPFMNNTMSINYIQQALIKTDENTHGGSDVTVHARGPLSHLLHKVHENSYVAHVISYALRIGKYKRMTTWRNTMHSSSNT